MKEIKRQVYQYCCDFVQTRINQAEEGMRAVQEAANNETKSSVGDKYETGRAMMHLEKEKLAEQLSAALKMKKVLDQINPDQSSDQVGLGSLVMTSGANYFLSISAGKVDIERATYFAVSPVSPIGQKLAGKRVGEEMTFAGNKMTIESVY